ncbi:GNAT family N-acetyltransferase [Micromonospora sp. NPDC048839]|uniref:GNAT family N-acetyltransferase n=1 Tax=Micromonospora sp. NPDC048839 TaxID=3155641 RepID=UPI0033EB5D83
MTDTSTSLGVRRATPSDAQPLVSVLAEAFFVGPVADWLIPDHRDRRLAYHRYFELVLDHGLAHGHVDTYADLSAVAIWYPRLTPPEPGSAEHQEALERATGAYAPKFALLEAMFEAYHPHDAHHYLAYVAVDPKQQRRGLGTRLLSGYHQQLDALGMPAYLEATNNRNRRLYQRLGYLPGPSMHLPTAGPEIWRMWRAPRGATVPDAFFAPPLPPRQSQ